MQFVLFPLYVSGLSPHNATEKALELMLQSIIALLSLYVSGLSPQNATEKALALMLQRVNGLGGAVALNTKGEVGYAFTDKQMTWAWAKDDVLHFGMSPGDDFRKELLCFDITKRKLTVKIANKSIKR